MFGNTVSIRRQQCVSAWVWAKIYEEGGGGRRGPVGFLDIFYKKNVVHWPS